MNTPVEPILPIGKPLPLGEGAVRPGKFRPLTAVERKDSVRHEAIRADVAKRLRKACTHLNEKEFAALVDKIVKVQLKGEKRPQ